MVQHSVITMILIILKAKGCFAFLFFLILTIMQWLMNDKCDTCQYMAMQQIQ